MGCRDKMKSNWEEFRVEVFLERKFICIRFPYDRALNESLKKTTENAGYGWDAKRRVWLIPRSAGGLRAVGEWIEGLERMRIPVVADARVRRALDRASGGRLDSDARREYEKHRAHLEKMAESIETAVQDRIRRFQQEGRRRFGDLWDQD